MTRFLRGDSFVPTVASIERVRQRNWRFVEQQKDQPDPERTAWIAVLTPTAMHRIFTCVGVSSAVRWLSQRPPYQHYCFLCPYWSVNKGVLSMNRLNTIRFGLFGFRCLTRQICQISVTLVNDPAPQILRW